MRSPIDRRAGYDLADVGEAIGDPSRAAMLIALMGGTARPASELARAAEIAPSTATTHLKRLVEAGLVDVHAQGRHRYYRLSNEQVASAVEGLAMLAAPRAVKRPELGEAITRARTCYGHLAGRVAVAFWARAREAGWVRWTDVSVTLLDAGREALAHTGLAGDHEKPLAGRTCIDWSERVPHVSGALGVALYDALLASRWITRAPEGRVVCITPRGLEALASLGVRA